MAVDIRMIKGREVRKAEHKIEPFLIDRDPVRVCELLDSPPDCTFSSPFFGRFLIPELSASWRSGGVTIEPLLMAHQPLSSTSHLNADKLGMKKYSPRRSTLNVSVPRTITSSLINLDTPITRG